MGRAATRARCQHTSAAPITVAVLAQPGCIQPPTGRPRDCVPGMSAKLVARWRPLSPQPSENLWERTGKWRGLWETGQVQCPRSVPGTQMDGCCRSGCKAASESSPGGSARSWDIRRCGRRLRMGCVLRPHTPGLPRTQLDLACALQGTWAGPTLRSPLPLSSPLPLFPIALSSLVRVSTFTPPRGGADRG